MDLENIVIPELGDDADVVVKNEEEGLAISLKNLINIPTKTSTCEISFTYDFTIIISF